MDNHLNALPCSYIATDNQCIIKSVNQTFLDLLQTERADLIGSHIETLMSTANRFLFNSYIYPAIQMKGFVNEMYLSLTSKQGKIIHVIFYARRIIEDDQEMIICAIMPIPKRIEYEKEIRGISKKMELAYHEKEEALEKLEILHDENREKQERLMELNKRLDQLASIDNLTGLKNRRVFLETLDQQIELFQAAGITFSLLILDIDHFKKVNDKWGHLVGDQVLIQLARLLENSARIGDVTARYGGEEFVMLLPNTNEETAAAFANSLRKSVESEVWDDISITISLGLATFTENDTHHSLLAKADYALYSSKNNGRNRVTASSTLTNELFENY